MAEHSEMRARLARLGSELAADTATIDALGVEISEKADALTRDPRAGPELAYLAVRIHRYYTGIETAIERIERVFGSGPSGGDWHLELLTGAALDIPDVRPAILASELMQPLRELLRFRHFFRHAYAVELDAAKLRRLGDIVRDVHPEVRASFERFSEFVSRAGNALAVR